MKRLLPILFMLGCIAGCRLVDFSDGKESPADQGIDIKNPSDPNSSGYMYPAARDVSVTTRGDSAISVQWHANKKGIREYTCHLENTEYPEWQFTTTMTDSSWHSPGLDDGNYEFWITAVDVINRSTPQDSIEKTPFEIRAVANSITPMVYLYPRWGYAASGDTFSVVVKAANFDAGTVMAISINLTLPEGIECTGIGDMGFLGTNAEIVSLNTKDTSPISINHARTGSPAVTPNRGGDIARIHLQATGTFNQAGDLTLTAQVRDEKNNDIAHTNRGGRVEVKQ